jgi:hypothetical protein
MQIDPLVFLFLLVFAYLLGWGVGQSDLGWIVRGGYQPQRGMGPDSDPDKPPKDWTAITEAPVRRDS